MAYHRVREACAAGIIHFLPIPGTISVADLLAKFLPWSTLKELVGPILFWKGETDIEVNREVGATQGSRGVTGTKVNHTMWSVNGRSVHLGVSTPEWLHPEECMDGVQHGDTSTHVNPNPNKDAHMNTTIYGACISPTE